MRARQSAAASHAATTSSSTPSVAVPSGWAYIGRPLSELPDVARNIVQATAGVREGTTVSPATIRNRLACLKAACRWSWRKHGFVDHGPTSRPAVRNERHVYEQRAGMLRLTRAADRTDVRVAIRIAFYTGLRLGKIGRVGVRAGMLELTDSKNSDRRSIPAHPRIAACLRYLPLTAPKITLQRGWARARRAVGMDGVTFHDLRHSTASEMVNAGVDLYSRPRSGAPRPSVYTAL